MSMSSYVRQLETSIKSKESYAPKGRYRKVKIAAGRDPTLVKEQLYGESAGVSPPSLIQNADVSSDSPVKGRIQTWPDERHISSSAREP